MKNHPRQGKRVRSLAHLADLIGQQRSVFVPSVSGYDAPRAAAFTINASGATINMLLKAGMYVYKKP